MFWGSSRGSARGKQHTLPVHPETGLHYRQIVPASWGPFVECRATLSALAITRPWLSVITPEQFGAERKNAAFWQSPSLCYLDWSNELAAIGNPRDRKCLVAIYALEALGAEDKMLSSHRRHWARFRECAQNYDAVLAYEPALVAQIQTWGLVTGLYPLGWTPLTAGYPRWGTAKFEDYVYWGSPAGKRQAIVPFLKKSLEGHFVDASGTFGRRLTGVLDTARAALHIAHSDVPTFAQWRAWQAMASSAAIVAERVAAWPLVADQHYLAIEPITLDNLDATAAHLRQLIIRDRERPLFQPIALAANVLGSQFRAEWCLDHYLLPASLAMKERRR